MAAAVKVAIFFGNAASIGASAPLNRTLVDEPGAAVFNSYLIAARASATRATSHGAVKVRMPTGSNTEPQVAGSATTSTLTVSRARASCGLAVFVRKLNSGK